MVASRRRVGKGATSHRHEGGGEDAGGKSGGLHRKHVELLASAIRAIGKPRSPLTLNYGVSQRLVPAMTGECNLHPEQIPKCWTRVIRGGGGRPRDDLEDHDLKSAGASAGAFPLRPCGPPVPCPSGPGEAGVGRAEWSVAELRPSHGRRPKMS